MAERAEDARKKTKALEQLLASGATPDQLFVAATNARLALEFREADRAIGLDGVDPEVVTALREAAKRALAAAAERAHVQAALELAQWAFDDRDDAAAPGAYRALLRVADAEKSGRAHRLLGYFVFHGLGCAMDRVASFEHHKKAASCGDADAMFELYAMLAQGIGTAQDDEQALVWCKRAAEAGNARAMANLGGFYATGRGLPRDDALAVHWYQRAADEGHGKAAAILGVMFALGQGAPRDAKRARDAFDRAEELGFEWRALASSLGVDADALVAPSARRRGTEEKSVNHAKKKHSEARRKPKRGAGELSKTSADADVAATKAHEPSSRASASARRIGKVADEKRVEKRIVKKVVAETAKKPTRARTAKTRRDEPTAAGPSGRRPPPAVTPKAEPKAKARATSEEKNATTRKKPTARTSAEGQGAKRAGSGRRAPAKSRRKTRTATRRTRR